LFEEVKIPNVYGFKYEYQNGFNNWSLLRQIGLPGILRRQNKGNTAAELGKAGGPLSHKLHMWFAIKDRLWKAGRLERQGMDHLSQCSLCCQE
jgi:hypothetical protein